MRKNNSVRVSAPRFLDEQPGDDDEEMTEADWKKAIEEAIGLAVAAAQRVRSACGALAARLQLHEASLVMLRTRGERPTVMLAEVAKNLPAEAILMVVSNHTTDDEIVSHVSQVVTRDVLVARALLENKLAKVANEISSEGPQDN